MPDRMPDEEHDVLGPLSTTPVPLVSADRVRARGRQRARRTRALLAGSGVLLVAALGGGAALLADRDGSTALVPVVTPTPTPTHTLIVEPAPTVSPTASPCGDGARCLPVPSELKPTLYESPAAGSVADLPANTLVTVGSLQQAFPGAAGASWVRYASSRTSAPWDVEPCGSPVGRPTASYLAGSYQLEEAGYGAVPEGPELRDQISRMTGPAQAAATVTAFRRAVVSCPIASFETTFGGESAPTPVTYKNDVVSDEPLIIARLSEAGGSDGSGEPAFYPFPIYYGIVAVDDLVAVWQYSAGETTDLEGALVVAGLVREGLCRNTRTC